jgi:hypothetical protein
MGSCCIKTTVILVEESLTTSIGHASEQNSQRSFDKLRMTIRSNKSLTRLCRPEVDGYQGSPILLILLILSKNLPLLSFMSLLSQFRPFC